MRTLNLPSGPRWAIAALTPLALIGLGMFAANPDYADAAAPARLSVLAVALLALALLRDEGNDMYGPEAPAIVLAIVTGLWAFLVLGTGRHPAAKLRRHPGATDGLRDA
ncbi:hypothetical protein ACFV4P_03450 [Kitasatospora sp. NPDC059795]|uniref:hypothetical protein n=1 Tax=Kitasatospora sp. NPDC059795 TaxID=3346949 RepID=UPI0036563635